MLRKTLDAALAEAARFRRAEISALTYEAALLTLGFYNVEFAPCAAAFDGVRYDLEPTWKEARGLHDRWRGAAAQYHGASVEAEAEAFMHQLGLPLNRKRYLEHVRLASEGLASLQHLGIPPEGAFQ